MPNYSGIWTEQAVMQAVGAGNWPGNPGAPTIGTATAGDASASVTFTAPTDTGQSAIVSYTVTSSPGSLTGTGSASPITVSGLTNGTAYTFTVTATNATGTGPASAASNSVTPAEPVYVENVYSTYLYTGTGTTNNIVNGIDLAGKGGLVWTKARTTTSAFAFSHALIDTVRGAGIQLVSNGTSGNATQADSLTAFNSNGYTLGADTGQGRVNNSSYGTQTYVGWTFREQAKFFDIVTYTGTGSVQNIAHNLGSTPGCILIKNLTDADSWSVYHQSLGATQTLCLNATTAAVADGNTNFNNTAPTSTQFTVNTAARTNQSGNNYVAYLFAHNAGGFGLNGTDNVISCGSYTGTGAGGNTITLGYEPQWLLVKNITTSGQEWGMFDIMRGLRNGGGDGTPSDAQLFANSSNAENSSIYFAPTSTGFFCEDASTRYNASSNTYVYVAIRRGPMKVPTSATSVFLPTTQDAGTNISVGFPADLWMGNNTGGDGSGNNHTFATRLQNQAWLRTPRTDAETAATNTIFWDLQNSFKNNQFGGSRAEYLLARAPSFMDVVCYTGLDQFTGAAGFAAQALTHNLAVAPEFMIVKSRGATGNWFCYFASNGNSSDIFINNTDAKRTGVVTWNQFTPTSTTFQVNAAAGINTTGATYIAYLFATLAGISKVGTYTGTGALQTVNCGFTAGARFVLIKRSDSTGDWFVYDSARGISSGNDPYYLFNTDAAQTTGTNYVDTTAVGFQVTAAAPSGLNASGGTYIFLAIA